MFGGIIEATGKISLIDRTSNGATLCFHAGRLASRIRNGDSIAVDGVCLTVTRKTGLQVFVDVSAETLRRTNFRSRKEGDEVNLELPLTLSTFLSGHLVQGHVEGVATVSKWIKDGDDVRMFVRLPPPLLPYCVPKGSITINGVSLTIASLRGKIASFALIPYTLQHTNLGAVRSGDLVNVETDVIGRYVVTTIKKNYHDFRL